MCSPATKRDYEPQCETGLGILRAHDVQVLRRGGELVAITPEIREFLREPKPLIITKANVRSRVHRRVYMDYIGGQALRRRRQAGRRIPHRRPVHLDRLYALDARDPLSAPQGRRLMRRAGFDPDGHSGKALADVLETYPRDELFQIDEDTLYEFALAILQLDERPRVRVLARRDRFDRFVSVLVFVPRERYDSGARSRSATYLAGVYNGRVSAFYPFFPEGPLVRVHYIIGRTATRRRTRIAPTLERAVEADRAHLDGRARRGASLAHDPNKARQLVARYRDAFSAAYREAYSPATAVADIRVIEGLSPSRRSASTSTPPRGEAGPARAQGLELRAADPAVGARAGAGEHGLPRRRRAHLPDRAGRPAPRSLVPRHDAGARRRRRVRSRGAASARWKRCFIAVMRGRAENDGYNALVLTAGLHGATLR